MNFIRTHIYMVKYMGTYGYLLVNAYTWQGTHYVPDLMK